MPHLPLRPTISFVLATYNRGQTLIDCLRKTLACGLPQSQFSIHVVDNASTDDTLSRLNILASEHRNLHFTPLHKNSGPVAKNVALHGNNADLIVLLDDDAYPLPGSTLQMIRHFQDDPRLGAAVFDVTLPDGAKEASAYPDVFIGAGSALRGEALRSLRPPPRCRAEAPLPPHFFMQAEEYDLSFRMLEAGWSIQRFWDMPLMHLKSPGARIGQRTTRLDVRNNLWLLARYVPEPLCHQLAADWLSRYWQMAVRRDLHLAPGLPGETSPNTKSASSHKQAFIRGAAEGLDQWNRHRDSQHRILSPETLERIFKQEAIRARMARARDRLGLRRIAFGDWGKNLLPYYQAARELGLEVTSVVDENLSGVEYRGIPVIVEPDFQQDVDALIVTAMSPVHASRRCAALRRIFHIPVVDLFGRSIGVTSQFGATPGSGTKDPLLEHAEV